MNLIEVSDSIYRYSDTCNVYVVKNGTKGFLVDFGSGAVLDHLSDIGITEVTDVLITHHHRDQVQGLARAFAANIRIWVPHTEQDLFRNADEHWQARELMNNYNVRQDRFSLLESTPVDGTLQDYRTYSFCGYEVTAVPTPGHTVGSVSLFVRLNGETAAFTGDLIAAPGKLWSLSATQWTYNGCEGVAYTILSLLDVQKRRPDLLLPSHGNPISDVAEACEMTIDNLMSLLKLRNQQHQHLQKMIEDPYERITPHILINRSSHARSYVLLSDTGKALIIDYGYDFHFGLAAGVDRSSRRPWLYSIDVLKEKYGVTRIDVAMPTHYHDDHVAGLNLLRDVEGAQIWAAEQFAELLQNPAAADVPCLWYDPIPVDKQLPLEREIVWEEYSFQLYHQPGHTYYAVAISFEADGKRFLAIGDQQGNDGYPWNYVYKNQFRMHDYRLSGELYVRLKPDVILSGHWEPYFPEPSYFEFLLEKGQALEQIHQALLPLDTIDLGAEGLCAWIRPFHLFVEAGSIVTLTAEIRNPSRRRETITAALVTPSSWNMEASVRKLELDPGESSEVEFRFAAPYCWGKRQRVAVDITIGEMKLGQHADALITIH